MRKLKIAFISLLFALPTLSNAQSENFDIAKSLNIQSSIIKILKSQYVDSVNVEKLVVNGINSMLSTLDPYTIYIPEENEEDIDMLTTGSYGGVGSLIKKLPSGEVQISEPYIGSPAVKYGLQPGDLLLAIDGVSTKDINVTECSKKMRGLPGTELKLKVKKGRSGDTVDINLTRERIHIPDVAYSGMLNDTVGYIQLGGFTLNGSNDVKEAFLRLREGGKMKKLVLDLRGNGGGLMSEAVSLVSLFVPNGTLVVTSKGRDTSSLMKFHTQKEPIDTTTPIVVMVNSGSASSSEIVAGALQDLDRATIVGMRTFGKGLVQSIKNTGYNTSLKLTTSKYYTPSGRCVQAIDYSKRNSDGSVGNVPDSLKKEFKTASGRIVYDGGGIQPDIELKGRDFNRSMYALVYSDVIGDFAIDYYKKHEKVASPSQFSISDQVYEDFIKYALKLEFDFRTDSQIEMEKVIEASKKDGLWKEYSKEIESLQKKLSPAKEDFLRKYKEDIKDIIEQEIMVKYYYAPGGAEYSLRNDIQIKELLTR